MRNRSVGQAIGRRAALPIWLALAAILQVGAALAQQNPPINIEIEVRDADGQPVDGAVVRVRGLTTGATAEGTTGEPDSGKVKLTRREDGGALPADVYVIEVLKFEPSGVLTRTGLEARFSARTGRTAAIFGKGGTWGIRMLTTRLRPSDSSLDGLVKAAEAAAKKCDAAAYDAALKQIQEIIDMQQKELADIERRAAELAKARQVPVSSLAPGIRQEIEAARRRLEASRRALQSIPPLQQCPPQPGATPPQQDAQPGDKPKEPRFGMAPVPGGCADEKFAGGLGSLLGLPVACDTEPHRRKDTDRKAGGKERDHERE